MNLVWMLKIVTIKNYEIEISTYQYLAVAVGQTESSDINRKSENHAVEMSRNKNDQVIGFVENILELILEGVVKNDDVD